MKLSSPINVFLSVGHCFNKEQEEFVSAVERLFAEHRLQPRTIGRNEFTHTDPLRPILTRMDRSAGAFVIAFERVYVQTGFHKRGSRGEEMLSDQSITTPWNHIEAALAYSRQLPLLAIRQPSVRDDGLLEGKYGWMVLKTELDPDFLRTPLFLGTFDSWHRNVKKRAGWFGCRN